MFQRKLMAVLSLVALLAIPTGVSYASGSRADALTAGVSDLNYYFDDYVNIYGFPTSVVRQNNLVLAELGTNAGGGTTPVFFDKQSLTVVRNFPKFGAVAFQMKESALNNRLASGNLGHEQLDAIWGKAFQKVDFAVRLDVTNSSFERTVISAPDKAVIRARGDGFDPFDPYPFGGFFHNAILGNFTPAIELNTVGVTPAIAIHMQNDGRFEGAVTYRKYSLDRSASDPADLLGADDGAKWADDGSSSYAVRVRAFINKGDKHVWVPVGWYVNDDLSWKVTGVPAPADIRSADETYKSYGIGFSDNMRVNDNNLLLWGVQVSQDKHEFERTDSAILAGEESKFEAKTSNTPLVFAAIETDATKWLKVRIGANRAYESTRNVTTDFGAAGPTDTEKFHGSTFNFNSGVGIHLNNLDLDWVLNQKYPLSGGWVMSGSAATPFTRASATYHF